MASVIFGCGDVGRRIVHELTNAGSDVTNIRAFVRSVESANLCTQMGVVADRVELDEARHGDYSTCVGAELYYTVAPQREGLEDERSRSLLKQFSVGQIRPSKVVLISTTGVYGDCGGEWVDEQSPTNPVTERGQRRLNSEQQWLAWGEAQGVAVVVLRVPGIYAHSRLPRKRIAARIPVVKADECGFSNRIHADDLALVCIAAMRLGKAGAVFNVTDGTPGKISEYLQAASKVLGFEALPEISMEQAQNELSAGMLSYLGESRKISNRKMRHDLEVVLRYPDFRVGIKY